MVTRRIDEVKRAHSQHTDRSTKPRPAVDLLQSAPRHARLFAAKHRVCVRSTESSSTSIESTTMRWFRRRVALETQLEELTQCGLTLAPEAREEDLTMFETRDALEREPYRGLIEAMGFDLEREPFTPICDRLWMCDYERIEDHGAYVEILERLETMTGGALGVTRPTDHVDLDEEVAWLEFELGGQRIHWDFEFDDDWMDPKILIEYDELLAQRGSALRLYSNHRDYGQVAFIGAFRPDEKQQFDRRSKIRLRPLPD